jgi:pimeloyl-ACP methyl ester carboxylesterase
VVPINSVVDMTNIKLLFCATIFFVLSITYSFGQYACITNNTGVPIYPAAYVPNQGICFASETAYADIPGSAYSANFWGSIQFGLFGNPNNVPYAGQATGDLGTQIPGSVTTSPCQVPQFSNHPPPLLWASRFSPGVHVVTVTFSRCDGLAQQSFSASVVVTVLHYPQSTPCTPELIDPVASQLLRGTSITTNTAILASVGSSVQGVSADGVTKALVRIPANQVGDNLTVTVMNDQSPPSQSSSAVEDGGLAELGSNTNSASSTLSTTAVNTPQGPMAFAVYSAPTNFSRGAQDDGAKQRNVTLQVNCPDTSGSPTTASSSVLIARPPVVLVHGMWSNAAVWNNFNPLGMPDPSIGDPRFLIRRANYDSVLTNPVSTTPTYPATGLTQSIRQSALGFSYNAPFVMAAINNAVLDLENKYNVAAVQADVVSHSMGGLVVRTAASLPGFLGTANYGVGPVHKLITIGTPHLGTPLATQLLQSGNGCVRDFLAAAKLVSLQTATFTVTLNGAVGDMQGDGVGGGLSAALADLSSNTPFPMAYIAGSATSGNLSGAGSTSKGLVMRACGTVFSDPLGAALTSQSWPNIFAADPTYGHDSDAIVPIRSQLNNNSGSISPNVIHTADIEQLGFGGPGELEGTNTVPNIVINLLNEASSGSDFH